jgi:hypothetical protein
MVFVKMLDFDYLEIHCVRVRVVNMQSDVLLLNYFFHE